MGSVRSVRPRSVALVVIATALLLVAVLGGGRWALAPSFSESGVPTVFVGDSITQAGSESAVRMPSGRSWVRYVVTDDRTPWRFVANVAVRGRRLDEMAARFEREVLAREPQGVVLLGGTNDTLQGVPVAASLVPLEAMVVAAQEAGAAVWVVAPPPLAPGRGDIVALRVAEQALVEELGATWVDVVDSVAGPDGSWSPGMSRDGVHPTRAGARAWGVAVLAAVS